MKGRAYAGRKCSRFYCYRVRERRCCADCVMAKKKSCKKPCQNHPDKCGLVEQREKEEKNRAENKD